MLQSKAEKLIEAKSLTRYFGDVPVVNRISFEVAKGSVFAFLGRNGAGKSTTIKMLLGLLKPDFGSAKILNHDSDKLPNKLREAIGYLPESHPYFDWMTVAEYLSFQKSFYTKWDDTLMSMLLGEFSINRKKKLGTLSQGQRSIFSLATVLSQTPQILLLDEPTLGLDPVAQHFYMELLLKQVREKNMTILISSHQLTDMERIADQIAIIENGQLKVNCSVDTFQQKMSLWSLQFESAPPRIGNLPGLVDAQIMSREVRLTMANINSRAKGEMQALKPISIAELPLSFSNAAVNYLKKSSLNKSTKDKVVSPHV